MQLSWYFWLTHLYWGIMCVYLDIFFSSMTGEIGCFVDMYSIFHLQNGIKAVFKRTYRCPWQFSFLCHLVLQLRLKALLSCLVFCAVVARPDFAVVGSGLKRPCTPAWEHYPYSRDWPNTVFMRFWVAWEMLKCWIHFLISVLSVFCQSKLDHQCGGFRQNSTGAELGCREVDCEKHLEIEDCHQKQQEEQRNLGVGTVW